MGDVNSIRLNTPKGCLLEHMEEEIPDSAGKQPLEGGGGGGHAARSDSRQGHHRAVSASLQPPRDWRRPRGRPRTTWLRGIDTDVG